MISVNHYNNLCLVTLPSPSPSADPDKLQSKLDALEKVKELCENYTNLNNPSNVPKNILVNLCDGLQTFLGFDPSSKGYDGTGIVYSDLDRLCDGVMGFLSGVLGAVKDDDVVKTYDKKDENIEKVINTLQSQIGSGRAGLVESVDAVKRWLKKYWMQVDEKNHDVISQLSTLNDMLCTTYKDKINESQNLQSQRELWMSMMDNVEKYLNQIETHNVGALDCALIKIITHEIKVVREAVVMLHDSAAEAVFGWQVKQVDDELISQKSNLDRVIESGIKNIEKALTQQENHVVNTINTDFPNLQQTLNDGYKNILSNINILKTTKNEQSQNLRNVLRDCESYLRKLDVDNREKLQGYFNGISTKVTELDATNTYVDGDGINSRFKRDVDVLRSKVNDIDKLLESYERRLVTWMHGASGLIKKAQDKCIDNVKLASGSLKSEITEAAETIKQQATTFNHQFLGVISQLEKEVEKVVGKGGDNNPLNRLRNLQKQLKVPDALDEFKDGDGWNMTGIETYKARLISEVKRHVGSQILEQIKTQVDDIKGPVNPEIKKTGLTGIRERVKAYAAAFTKNNFPNVVKSWTMEILKTNAVVIDRLQSYIDSNTGKLNNNYKTASEMVETLCGKIMGELDKDVIKNVSYSATGTDVTTNVTTVQGICKSFSSALEDTMKSTSKNALVYRVYKAVEAMLKKPDVTAYVNYNLISAVDATLVALLATSRQIVCELKSFVLDESDNPSTGNIATSVENALITASSLSSNLSKAHRTAIDSVSNPGPFAGNPIATGVDGIAGKVNSMSTQLGELLRTAVNTYIRKLQDALNSSSINTIGTLNKDVSKFSVPAEQAKLAIVEKAGIVETKLGEYTKEFSNSSSDAHGFLYTLQEEHIKKKLRDIKMQIDLLKTDKVHDVTRRIDGVLNKIKILETVPGEVEEKRDATLKLMQDLRTELDTKLQNISAVITAVDIEMSKALNEISETLLQAKVAADRTVSAVKLDITRAVQTAFQTSKQAVEEHRNALMNAVQSAFALVTHQVRCLFAEGHRADLKALQTLLDKQVTTIKKIINNDLTTNVKGFMRRLSGVPVDATTISVSDNKLAVLQTATSSGDNATKFRQLSERFHAYYTNVDNYIKDQVKPPTTVPPTDQPTDPAKQLTKIKSDFDELLKNLIDENGSKKYNYNNDFVNLLSSLKDATNDLSPSHFANPRHPELLDAVRAGLDGFVGEMGRVYVNGYDDGQPIDWNTNKLVEKKSVSGKSGEKEKLTPYGEKLSKICLTILDVLNRDIDVLRVKCPASGKGEEHKIITGNSIGKWFQGRGYKVSDSDTKQHGELVNKIKNGGIKSLCETPINGLSKDVLEVLRRQQFSKDGKTTTLYQLLNHLYDRLDKYRRVCHLRHIPNPKAPTTVNHMLHWLSGLYWNSMYEKLRAYLQTWFHEYTTEYGLESDYFKIAVPARYGKNMIQTASLGNLENLFKNVTVRAPIILTTILGHGQTDGRYACDFYTNPDDLLYPTRDSECFDMFVDICLRLNEQLRFLYAQCHNGPDSSGWRDCWYGRDVGGSAWKCNKLQCAGQIGEQKHNQSCDQKCEQNAQCGLKSPLQSFLEDGLPGFLPHQFGGPGCKLTCTSANHFGKPCKTPMGFRDLSVTASHRQKGQQIKTVLDPFSGPVPDSLTLLCGYFQCLLRRPPQTLCDMYSFYYNYLENWQGADGSNPVKVQQHKQKAFDEAVQRANFWNEQTRLEITSIQCSSVHDNECKTHDQGDLFGLLSCNPDATPSLPCGQYLQPLNMDTRNIFSKEQAGLYLSWVVYITETFYDLLRKLRDECCKTCNTPGAKCCGKKCANGCRVKYIDDSGKPTNPSTSDNHKDGCKSIMSCPDTHPNLYKYGFTFGSPYKLSGESNEQKHKRTCQDFCEALNKVVKENNVLYLLVHKHIPNFLWEIREKFFWTTVALWSASFLYLIYVMVGRLDLLHIKSHLRSPASHRITAQSLLAAARVGRLSKIAYLQP